MDEGVSQLTEAGCEIYPMQWIEVDKHAQRDLAQNLQLVMWIGKMLFAAGVHSLMFPFTRAISRTDIFQEKKLIGSCCIAFQLKVFQKELHAERFWHHVYPPMVQRMQDADCGFD